MLIKRLIKRIKFVLSDHRISIVVVDDNTITLAREFAIYIYVNYYVLYIYI